MKKIIIAFILLTGIMFGQKSYLVWEIDSVKLDLSQLQTHLGSIDDALESVANQLTILGTNGSNNTVLLYQVITAIDSIQKRLSLIEGGGGITVPDPQAPLNLIATATDSNHISIDWDVPASGTTPDSFRIYRSLENITGGLTYHWIASVPYGTTIYSNSGLSSSTTYRYVVRSLVIGSIYYESSNSNSDTATTPAGPTPVTTKIDYYVDATNGSDLNDGKSEAKPWKTLAKVTNQTFAENTTIAFKRGERFYGGMTISESGSSGKPITFTCYGSSGSLPLLSASSPITGTWGLYQANIYRISTTTNPSQLYFIKSDSTEARGYKQTSISACNGDYKFYWASNYLYVYATSNPSTYFKLVTRPTADNIVLSGNYIEIKNLDIAYSSGDEVRLSGQYLRVYKNKIHHTGIDPSNEQGGDGVYITNKNNYVGYNEVYENAVHGIYAQSYSGGETGGNIIEHNIVTNHYHTGIDIMCDQVGRTNRGNIVRYNYVSDNDNKWAPGFSSIGIQFQGYRTDADTSQHAWERYNWCYGNVVVNPDGIGINFQAFTDSNYVFNNVVYSASSHGIVIHDWAYQTPKSHSWVFNNISVNNTYSAIALDYQTNKICDYNLWRQSTGSFWCITNGGSSITNFTTWKNTYGFDTHGFNADPLFVNAGTDFKLQAGSPCINSGTNTVNSSPYNYTLDINGYTVPTNTITDIGANEKQ